MNKKRRYELLMEYRNKGFRLISYMGYRWIVSKVLIAAIAIFMLAWQDKITRSVGLVLIGYLMGVVVANVRGYVLAKAAWKEQKELIDWNEIEKYLKEETKSSD